MTSNNRNEYGAFLNLPPGSKVDRRFVDRDGDGTDDRYQAAPGRPRGGSSSPKQYDGSGITGIPSGSPAGTKPPWVKTSVPANVQNAWNLFTNPPTGTGGFRPTKEMMAQFQQYGLSNQSSNTRIGSTLPDGSVKGDRNQDGRFGMNDFTLPRVTPASSSPSPASSPAFADKVRDARVDMYGNAKRKGRSRIDAIQLAKAMP